MRYVRANPSQPPDELAFALARVLHVPFDRWKEVKIGVFIVLLQAGDPQFGIQPRSGISAARSCRTDSGPRDPLELVLETVRWSIGRSSWPSNCIRSVDSPPGKVGDVVWESFGRGGD